MLPVRSAYIKQDTGGSVVRWVTTSESPLLYVFHFLRISTSVSKLAFFDVDMTGLDQSANEEEGVKALNPATQY